MKTIEVIAGPNGSGKTTFAESYLKYSSESKVFLNPDVIAQGISPVFSNENSIQAGRVLINEVRERLLKNEDFCFETTLSGKHWLRMLNKSKDQGYKVIIYFLFTDDSSINLTRIKNRVDLGGHDIPKSSVLRRIPRSFNNFWFLYRPLCDDWYIFNNTKGTPKLFMNLSQFQDFSNEEQEEFENIFLKISDLVK